MPPLDLNEIRKLVRLMEKAELSEIEIDDSKEGLRVHLKRGASGDQAPPMVHVVSAPGAAAPGAPLPVAGGTPADFGAGTAEATGGHPPGTEPFPSPMVGTFYRSPSPDSDSFVDVGSRFDEDTVLCIIEAMKVMNEIKAEDLKGEIVEVLVENGEPVEFGQPLFLVKKG